MLRTVNLSVFVSIVTELREHVYLLLVTQPSTELATVEDEITHEATTVHTIFSTEG